MAKPTKRKIYPITQEKAGGSQARGFHATRSLNVALKMQVGSVYTEFRMGLMFGGSEK